MDHLHRLPFNYVPTESACIAFLALFSVTTAVHLLQGLFVGPWFLIPTIVVCGIGEILGWSARLWGSRNPFLDEPFKMQISCTIISPSFLTAAMFSMLPQIIQRLGPQYSRLTPKYYQLFFIPVDVLALVIQGIGGGVASGATTRSGQDLGAHIMLAGILIQMAAIVLFVLCCAELLIRFHLDRPIRPEENQTGVYEKEGKTNQWQFVPNRLVYMIVAIVLATGLVFIRSVYRTIELSNGWTGRIISTEWVFNYFDGLPIVLAMIIFNFIHPGWFLYSAASHRSRDEDSASA